MTMDKCHSYCSQNKQNYLSHPCTVSPQVETAMLIYNFCCTLPILTKMLNWMKAWAVVYPKSVNRLKNVTGTGCGSTHL